MRYYAVTEVELCTAINDLLFFYSLLLRLAKNNYVLLVFILQWQSLIKLLQNALH